MDITVWYLSTCSTCTRILGELQLSESNADMIDVKSQSLTESQVEMMQEVVGSYKALINGRSTQFRSMEKKARDLSESESKQLLLKHYAFLKRPVIRIEDEFFVGNSKKTVEKIKKKIGSWLRLTR